MAAGIRCGKDEIFSYFRQGGDLYLVSESYGLGHLRSMPEYSGTRYDCTLELRSDDSQG